jgi:hypothetical protein
MPGKGTEAENIHKIITNLGLFCLRGELRTFIFLLEWIQGGRWRKRKNVFQLVPKEFDLIV